MGTCCRHSVVVDMSQCSSVLPWLMQGDCSVSHDISRGSATDPTLAFCNDCNYSQDINDTMDRPEDGMKSSFLDDEVDLQSSVALSKDLRCLPETRDLCDVQFMVGANRVAMYGVKAIIALRNRHLHQMIQHQMTNRRCRNRSHKELFTRKIGKIIWPGRKSQTVKVSPTYHTVEVTEFESEVFRPLLSYIHSGTAKITLRNVVGLLHAADTFDVADLRTSCFRLVEISLRVNTALKILKSSEPFGNRKVTKIIVSKVIDFIADRAAEVFRLREFDTISKQNIALIFSRSNLKATESEKWDAALCWSKRHCHKKGSAHLRRTMKMICRRIDFNNIPLTKVLTEVQPLAVLSDDVIGRLIQQQGQNRLVIGGESPAPRKPPRTRHTTRSSQNLFVSVFGKHWLESSLDLLPKTSSSTPQKILF